MTEIERECFLQYLPVLTGLPVDSKISQIKGGFHHVVRITPGNLPIEVYWAHPTKKSPLESVRTRWKYMSPVGPIAP